MYKVNDVTYWLSQTTDNSKQFVWYPGLWDKESRLYFKKDLFYITFYGKQSSVKKKLNSSNLWVVQPILTQDPTREFVAYVIL